MRRHVLGGGRRSIRTWLCVMECLAVVDEKFLVLPDAVRVRHVHTHKDLASVGIHALLVHRVGLLRHVVVVVDEPAEAEAETGIRALPDGQVPRNIGRTSLGLRVKSIG